MYKRDEAVRRLLSEAQRDRSVDERREILMQRAEAGESAEIHFGLGALAAMVCEDASAIQSLNRALALEPSHADAYAVLAQIYWLQKDSERAVALARSALAQEPDHRLAEKIQREAQRDLHPNSTSHENRRMTTFQIPTDEDRPEQVRLETLMAQERRHIAFWSGRPLYMKVILLLAFVGSLGVLALLGAFSWRALNMFDRIETQMSEPPSLPGTPLGVEPAPAAGDIQPPPKRLPPATKAPPNTPWDDVP